MPCIFENAEKAGKRTHDFWVTSFWQIDSRLERRHVDKPVSFVLCGGDGRKANHSERGGVILREKQREHFILPCLFWRKIMCLFRS